MADHALVTAGPFRYLRHPIYSAVAALWLGAALGALNWVLLVTSPMILAALFKGSAKEEEMLREKFGEAYDAYAEGKGRLVPRVDSATASLRLRSPAATRRWIRRRSSRTVYG